jgi:hypothetical protein
MHNSGISNINASTIMLAPVYDTHDNDIDSPIPSSSTYGHAIGNIIYLQDSVYLRDHTYQHPILGQSADLYTTLLHEGFHLVMTSTDGNSIKDMPLYKAMFNIRGINVIDSRNPSEAIGATFAHDCGDKRQNGRGGY